MTEPVELGRITIVKTITVDGDLDVSYGRSDGLTLLDALGMCAFAGHAFAADEMASDGRDG